MEGLIYCPVCDEEFDTGEDEIYRCPVCGSTDIEEL